MRSRPLTAAAVAAAYTLSGWLAIQLAVPPGYTAPVFPSAGIALAALLIFGDQLWPAILLGSLGVQAVAAINAGVEPSWSSLVIPVGATLQALAGSHLARRIVGFPNPLDAPLPIVKFLLVVAPVGCLVSAAIAVPSLAADGVIPLSELPFNGWAWWVGDTIGVILAAPLMLVFFGRPQADWRPRRVAVTVPLVIALALLGFTYHQVRHWEDLRIQARFTRDAEHLASLVHKRLDAQIDMMLAVERLMSVADDIDRARFHDFVTPLLERYPGAQNVAWSFYVTAGQRQAFEARMRRTMDPGFRIIDRDNAGRTFPAQSAVGYLPMTFVEPLATNREAVGLSPLSLQASADAIALSRKTGRAVATAALRPVQEHGGQRGVVIYLASIAGGAGADGALPPLRGMVSSVLRMDDALAATLDAADLANLELCLVDLDGVVGNTRLSGALGCESPAWLAEETSRSVPLPFAGRHWEMRLRATPGYLAGLRGWAGWTTMAVGLCSAGILGAFLLVSSGQTRRIAALVERRTAELATTGARLREQQAALVRAQRIARMGSWEMPIGGAALLCSEELGKVLGAGEAPLASTDSLAATLAEDDRPAFEAALARAAAAAGTVSLDCRLAADTRRVVHFQIESEWRDGRVWGVRGTAQDVTSAREAEAHIQYLAHCDPLTGLPNRSAWLAHARSTLHAAERHNDKLALLFLDLDQFKTINDSLGHPVGDRLLAVVAQRLRECLRQEDFLARLGGDEFVALLPRLEHSEDAAGAARKVLAALGRPVTIDGHELSPTVSIGIALFPDDAGDVDTLLKHADTAMYGAKEAGRDNFQFFVPEMNVRAFERLMLEGALRRAIERDELDLHYQPQVRAEDGALVGCEVLVRWRHPEFGLVMPSQFIPVAENSGLIVPLGMWVLRRACRQQVRWAEAGMHDLVVAVNISALQFRKADFATLVREVLVETGANPQRIELEITESALMEPSDELLQRLNRLVGMGLKLSLDDFGTGYSSLAYLKRLPIGRLKIDRSFVKDLPGDAEDAAVASATLSLARDLGLEVVAEGVETEAQREFLLRRGCSLMQGFLYARPMASADFEAWIAERQPA